MLLVFVRTKNYDILAGVLLALTGCEAMFARPVIAFRLELAVADSLCLFVVSAISTFCPSSSPSAFSSTRLLSLPTLAKEPASSRMGRLSCLTFFMPLFLGR